MRRPVQRDMALFITMILLLSSTSALVREELDRLILRGAASTDQLKVLLLARSRAAAFEAIAAHLG